MEIKQQTIDFMETIYTQKKVTRDDINIPMLSFYALSKYLKRNNLIIVNGVNDKNQHIYVLTSKGQRFAELIVKLKRLLEEPEGC